MTTAVTSENPWALETTSGVTDAVISEVATREGTSPFDLPPLFDAVNPEALNALFESTNRAPRQGQVRFDYHRYRVTVTCDGGVEVTTSDEPAVDRVSDADTVVRFGDPASVVEAIVAAVGVVGYPESDGSGDTAYDVQYSPLYEAVDPEALAALFPDSRDDGAAGSVSFPYCGCTVTVTADRRVAVTVDDSTDAD